MISFKAGASIRRVQPQLVLALYIADQIWEEWGRQAGVTVTSGDDGTHSGKPLSGDSKDPHYLGKALDLRIQDVDRPIRAGVVYQLTQGLGRDYDVFWESQGTANEHVHVQYNPK